MKKFGKKLGSITVEIIIIIAIVITILLSVIKPFLQKQAANITSKTESQITEILATPTPRP